MTRQRIARTVDRLSHSPSSLDTTETAHALSGEDKIPTAAGDRAISDHHFGPKMHAVLQDIGAEAAYFTTVDGHRGGYIIVDMKDASQIPSVAEPLFLWFNATVEILPVMLPEDLEKAGPSIAAAIEKWSPKS